MENLLTKYERNYSEESFWQKLKKQALKAGVQVVYLALILYFVFIDKKTPKRAKIIVASALGYFILPTDLIPDFILGVGYSDDLGALILAASQIISNINPEYKAQARAKLKDWFGEVDEEELAELENRL
ncbi:MAG: DUF1232 domain-containing protein [Bacteroidetes bacterium]|nr:DUF1232 domain-containing protein [Bacteroidota bacterium]